MHLFLYPFWVMEVFRKQSRFLRTVRVCNNLARIVEDHARGLRPFPKLELPIAGVVPDKIHRNLREPCAQLGITSERVPGAVVSTNNSAFNPDRVRKSQREGRERDKRGRVDSVNETTSNSETEGLEGQRDNAGAFYEQNRDTKFTNSGWWQPEPGVGRMVHGMANRTDRIEAIGDGQVPAVVKLAWECLS